MPTSPRYHLGDDVNLKKEVVKDLAGRRITQRRVKGIVKEVRQIIGKLQANNIIYPDITGYNFINFNDKIWIIDVNEFVKGLNSWNPYFK
jgi:tRNA A-37 threonylcarbamoyl transferase component Bud32